MKIDWKSKLMAAALAAWPLGAGAVGLEGALSVAFNQVKARAAEEIRSVYTDISDGACRRFGEESEDGGFRMRCGGINGYALVREYGDARESITVIGPDGKEYDQNYYETITGAFSSLGDKAEWRMKSVNGRFVPVALIVRVTAQHTGKDVANPVHRQFAAVSKIVPGEICVTNRIEQISNMTAVARSAADDSAGKPCLSR